MAEGDQEADDIPLLNVKSAILKKVIEYMRYHADNPPKDIEKVRRKIQARREIASLRTHR